MTPEINKILAEFGHAVVAEVEKIDPNWVSISITSTFYKDSVAGAARFLKENGAWDSFFVPMNARWALENVRDVYRQLNQPVWGQACYSIDAKGKFNLALGYQKLDVDGNTISDPDTDKSVLHPSGNYLD